MSWIPFLIISTVLAAAIGASLLLINLKQEDIPSNIIVVVVGDFLIFTSLVQKYTPRFSGTKETARIKDAIIVSVVQAFAAFPVLGRHGLIISPLLFRGYKPQRAIKISFLMSIPDVLSAMVRLDLIDVVTCDAAAFVFRILTIGAIYKLTTRIHFWKLCR